MKLIVKQILFLKLVKYWDKYTKMNGQQNVKKKNRWYFNVGEFTVIIVQAAVLYT